MPDATRILGHVVRNSPMHIAIKDGAPALFIVSFGDSYVSPDWYGVDDQVPTWNYVAVHVVGTAMALEPEALPAILAAQSAALEARLAPKPAWTSDKMSDGVYERMQRAIIPFELRIESIESTWKLSQNKPEEVRERTVAPLKDAQFGLNVSWIGEQMSAALAEERQRQD